MQIEKLIQFAIYHVFMSHHWIQDFDTVRRQRIRDSHKFTSLFDRMNYFAEKHGTLLARLEKNELLYGILRERENGKWLGLQHSLR
jgi:hypothetical protein